MPTNKTYKESDINKMIVQKLKEFPEDVAELSIAAVAWSEKYPEMTVFEHLEALVRQITKEGRNSVDIA